MRLSSLSASWWEPSWRRLACFGLLIGLLWLVVPGIARAQVAPSSSLTAIETSLLDSLTASTLLRQALTLQRDQRLALEIAYADLKARLKTSASSLQTEIERLETSLADSTQLSEGLQAEISRLTGLLTASSKESAELLQAYRLYSAEMSSQVEAVIREREAWKWGTIAAGIVAVLAVVAFLVK